MLLRRLGIAGLVTALITGIVAVAYFAAVFPDWTGFGPPLLDAQGHELPHAKTLWDWLDLLLVPLVLAVGGFLLTRSENREARQLQERRETEARKIEEQRITEARKIEEQRIEETRKIEEQRAQDAALQAYLDQMTQLLLHEKLRTSQPDDEVRSVARARTLTVLRVLDGVRKAKVLQFLYEARLIGGIKQETEGEYKTIDAIVSLDEANLDGAHLEGANLRGADLRAAHLDGAHLGGANLRGANLRAAHLDGAHLEWAHLEWTHLDAANLERAHLDLVHLEGAHLQAANLEGAHLEGAHLERAHLEWADLREAHLDGAFLFGAHLEEARLEGAFLKGVYLDGADLTNCTVTREQLAQAASLEGAKLPFDMTSPPQSVEGAASKD